MTYDEANRNHWKKVAIHKPVIVIGNNIVLPALLTKYAKYLHNAKEFESDLRLHFCLGMSTNISLVQQAFCYHKQLY